MLIDRKPVSLGNVGFHSQDNNTNEVVISANALHAVSKAGKSSARYNKVAKIEIVRPNITVIT